MADFSRLCGLFSLLFSVVASSSLLAQQGGGMGSLPVDPQILAQHLVAYTEVPGARFDRDIEVRFIADPAGVVHSAHVPVGDAPIATERQLCRLLEGIELAPSVAEKTTEEELIGVLLRFERGAGDVRRVVINGEHFSFPPLQGVRLPQPPLPEGVVIVEGTSTPPGVDANVLSMELNYAALSYQQILEGEVVASLIVEPDGSHGVPVAITSTIPDDDFTLDVAAIVSEATTTPGMAEELPVRSMLEIRVICSGKEGVGGRSEQVIRVAQRAPIPVPDGYGVRMDTIDIAEASQTITTREVETIEEMPGSATLELASGGLPAAESAEAPEERVITSEEKGSVVEVTEVPASYDPVELSENTTYPQDLLDARVRGYVMVSIGLDGTGEITTLDVFDASDERFIEAALDAVRATNYNPATLNGRGVESTLVISLEFGM